MADRGTLDTTRPETTSNGALTIGDTLGDEGFAIFGAAFFDQLGWSVAMVGDVNGDGFDDVAIGAHWTTHGRNFKDGAVYIIFGRASGFDDLYMRELDTAAKLAAKGVMAIYGTKPTQEELGFQVKAAGDVDGDGLADLLVGSGKDDAYVIFGHALAGSASAPVPTGVVKATLDQPNIDGTSTAGEFLQGSAVANAIGGIGSGDVAYGGAGDDSFTITKADFKRAYGGSGDDELVFGGNGLALDFSAHARAVARVKSIESIDLTGSGDNTLTLDEHAVYQLTEQRSGGKATLTIDGNAGDTLKLKEGIVVSSSSDTTKWKDVNGDGTLYALGNAVLAVESAISVVEVA